MPDAMDAFKPGDPYEDFKKQRSMPDDRGEAERITANWNDWRPHRVRQNLSRIKELIIAYAARVRQQAVDDCCKKMCEHCAAGNVPILWNGDWCHMTIPGGGVVCLANSIREQGRGG